MPAPIHHLHFRKRKDSEKDPYPHPDAKVRLLDRIVLFAGILGPMFTIPQILNIYVYANAAGVSPITWGVMAMFNVPWILYGIVHKTRVIITAYSLWLVVNSTIAIGAIMYG